MPEPQNRSPLATDRALTELARFGLFYPVDDVLHFQCLMHCWVVLPLYIPHKYYFSLNEVMVTFYL